VYGLTFTAHFYGARRSVGYVPFSSETLVTGKLFEDIRDAVHELADPEHYDAIVVTNLCVPTASGVPLQLLPKAINGVRIVGIDVPGFGIPTHAEAKDVLAGAMLAYARREAEAGPVAAPRERSDKPTIALLGEMFPADPVGIGMLLEPLGLAAGPVVPTREWRELYAALDCAAVAAIHPFYTASVRNSREPAGRSSARRPSAWRERRRGSTRSAAHAVSRKTKWMKPRTAPCPRSAPRSPPDPFQGASPCRAMKAPSFWSPAC
jgi:chlorophyllide a reductase subunit Y